jgi:hypothetical protein
VLAVANALHIGVRVRLLAQLAFIASEVASQKFRDVHVVGLVRASPQEGNPHDLR